MADNLLQYLQNAGFKGDALRTAWAIARRESGGRPDAYNPNRATGDDSYGLFQINMLGKMGESRRQQYGLQSNKDLLNPAVNATVAYKMSKGGTDFGAWGVGPNAYRKTTLDTSGFPGAGAAPAIGGGMQAAPALSQQTQAPVNAGQNVLRMISAFHQAQQARDQGQSGVLPLLGQIMQMRQRSAPQVTGPVPGQTASPPMSGEVVTSQGWKGTHVTDNLDWNHGSKTAGDIMAKAGTPVGAPEDGEIVRFGSAQGGESMYFKGVSGKMYWLGHIQNTLQPGAKVRANQPIALISSDHPNPHLHIDVLGGQ